MSLDATILIPLLIVGTFAIVIFIFLCCRASRNLAHRDTLLLHAQELRRESRKASRGDRTGSDRYYKGRRPHDTPNSRRAQPSHSNDSDSSDEIRHAERDDRIAVAELLEQRAARLPRDHWPGTRPQPRRYDRWDDRGNGRIGQIDLGQVRD